MPCSVRNARFALLPLLLALAALAGLAPTPVLRTDNFNDNTLAGFWTKDRLNQLNVREVRKRLEFNSTGSTGSASAAGVLFSPYGINWKQDFEIEWIGRLNLLNIPFSDKKCFMGTLLVVAGDFPLSMTGFGAGFYRDSSNLYFGVLRFEDGAITSIQGSVVVPTMNSYLPGLVEITWDRSIDRLTAELTPGPSGFQSGFFSAHPELQNSPMAIIQGILTLDGDLAITGGNAYMDSWKATFAKRAFP